MGSIINGLSKMNYNKAELENEELNIENVISLINKFDNFDEINLCNIINGLAQLGYRKKDLQGLNIDNIANGVDKNIQKLSELGISNLINGLVKIYFIDENNNPKVIEIINLLLKRLAEIRNVEENINTVNNTENNNKTSLNLNLFYLKAIKKVNGVNIPTNLNISNYAIFDKERTSLEKDFKEKYLNDIGSNFQEEVEILSSIEHDSIKYKHHIDFYCEFEGHKLYIELDGPSHFVGNDSNVKNSQTIVRDEINRSIISKTRGAYYITISMNEFNHYKNNNYPLGKLLSSKINGLFRGANENLDALNEKQL